MSVSEAREAFGTVQPSQPRELVTGYPQTTAKNPCFALLLNVRNRVRALTIRDRARVWKAGSCTSGGNRCNELIYQL